MHPSPFVSRPRRSRLESRHHKRPDSGSWRSRRPWCTVQKPLFTCNTRDHNEGTLRNERRGGREPGNLRSARNTQYPRPPGEKRRHPASLFIHRKAAVHHAHATFGPPLKKQHRGPSGPPLSPSCLCCGHTAVGRQRTRVMMVPWREERTSRYSDRLRKGFKMLHRKSFFESATMR